MKSFLYKKASLLAFCLILVVCGVFTLAPRSAQASKKQRQTTFAYTFMSFGVVPGQTARVSIANPHNYPPNPCTLVLYDPAGNVLASTGTFQLPAVQKTLEFDFPYQELSTVGTGARAQVRAVLTITSNSGIPPGPCFSSEILDQNTGATLVFIPQLPYIELPAVQ